MVETIEDAAKDLGLKASVATCTSWESDWDLDTTLATLGTDFDVLPQEKSERRDVRRRGLIASAKAGRRLGEVIGHTSRSHSPGVSIAIAIPESPGVLGIGIDLEPANRKISDRLHTRLRQRYGEFAGLDIELWCALEAVFKSDPSQGPTGLFSYRYESGAFGKEGIAFSHTTVHLEGYFVAIAVSHALRSS